MSRINEIRIETIIKKTGMKTGIILFIINVALFICLQVTNTSIPEIVKINILLTLGGIPLLNMRPRY